MAEQIETAERVLDFAAAAQAREQLARVYPKDERARDALEGAVELRLALGQHPQAAEDVALYERNWGRSFRDDAIALRLTVALHHGRHGRHDAAGEAARELLRTGRLSFAQKIVAKGLQARSFAARGDDAQAAALFAALDADTGNDEALAAVHGGDPKARRVAAEVLDVVGEARFRAAMVARAAVKLDAGPRYRGPAEVSRIQAFIQSRITPWLPTVMQRLDAADAAFTRVVSVRPAPPGRWAIAAAAEDGAMWAELVEFLLNPPWPNPLPADLSEVYRSTIDAVASPYGMRAKRSLETCLRYGELYQIANADTRRCESWLAEHYPREHPRHDELAPLLRRPGPSPPRARPVPLRDGAP